jgi:hypothetical protein
MKNILKITLIFSVFIFFSCEKQETLESLENQSMTFDELFEKVSSTDIQTSEENSIHIIYKWNKNNNTVSIISSEEKELSWGAALEIASLKNNSNFKERSFGGGYQVSCSNGDKSWNKKCSGKWSCGKAIGECLDQGGCAKICELKLEYYAPKRIFFLDSERLYKKHH